jgi:hypothetical protein
MSGFWLSQNNLKVVRQKLASRKKRTILEIPEAKVPVG